MSDISPEERAWIWLSEMLDQSDKLGRSILSQWTSILKQSANYRDGTKRQPKVLLSYQIVFWREASSVSFSIVATTAVSLLLLVPDLREAGIRCVYQVAVRE